MATAYALCALAWIFATIACWVAQYTWRFPAKYKVLTGIAAAIAFAFLSSGLAYYETIRRYELTHIVPGDAPTPPMPTADCSPPESALLVFLGNSHLSSATKFPRTIIAIGVDRDRQSYPMLQIDRQDNGLSIKLIRIFNDKGNVITTVHENEPFVNSNFRVNKPNPHQLIVFDDHDEEVINLQFLNPHAIMVTGLFRRPNEPMVRILQNEINVAGLHISGSCFLGGAVTDFCVRC
jgi:hypothetical protein